MTSDLYQEFVKSINSLSSYQDLEALFQWSEDYIKKIYKNVEVYFFSSPQNDVALKRCRVLWSRQKARKWLKEVGRDVLISEIENKEDFSRSIFFQIGMRKDQRFWIALSDKNNKKVLDQDFVDLLEKFLKRSLMIVNEWHEMNKLSGLVYIDDVTGLYNQRKLNKDIDELIRKYQVYNESFAVLFMDLDHFKGVNDDHGHLVGTRILVEVAQLLRQVVRDSDMLYRYGGDEFVVIVDNAEAQVAKSVGERILKAFKERKFKLKDDFFKELSASIGVAIFPTHANSKDAILAHADKMMYSAKKKGRGQVLLLE